MSQLLKIDPPSRVRPGQPPGFALWALGFRPFYLLGAGFAALGVPLWLLLYMGKLALPGAWSPQVWHAHEMVFGFALAIVCGFLFTAVRNWTGLDTPTGPRLAALCALWLTVRLAYLAGATLPALAGELLLLGLVAVILLRLLVRSGNRRNYFVGVLFVALAIADLVFHASVADLATGFTPLAAGRIGLYLVVALTTVIAGRVVPMFTLGAVRGVRQFRDARLDRAALVATLAAFGLDLAGIAGPALAAAASLAAALQLARLAGWGSFATLRHPLLWILHLAYAWLPAGLALMAAGAVGWLPGSLAAHAFGLGLIGGLVIGMITRTALGHTGRMLVAGRAETTMFVLVQAAALTRVGGAMLFAQDYMAVLVVAAALWSAGFGLYLVVYWPRLSRARVDGREG
jgi:uncharacterized protein involved in response to NO